jgi:hypothetical protein
MTTEQALSTADVDQIGLALNQIATDMKSIKSILDDMVSAGTFDHRGASIELLACRSGALADRSIETVGGVQVHGSLEKWLED